MNSFRTLIAHPWARIALAVALLLAGIAPIGVPILSDSFGEAVSDAETGIPFRLGYRSSAHADGVTRIERSDDHGASWHEVASLAEPVRSIQPLPGDEQVVLALGDRAVWASRDAGQSWSVTAPTPSRPVALAVSEAAVLVGTESGGLFVSRDLGASWTPAPIRSLAASSGAPLSVTAVAVDPDAPGTIYAAAAYWLGNTHARLAPAGLHASLDGGSTWFRMEPERESSEVVTVLRPVAGRPITVEAVSTSGATPADIPLDALLDGLGSSAAAVRTSAAVALGLMGDRRAIPALRRGLADPDDLAGYRAAEALGRLGDQGAIPLLITLAQSDMEAIQARASRALGLLGSEEAVSVLESVLVEGRPMASREAAQALALIGSHASRTALAQALITAEDAGALHAAMVGIEAAGEAIAPYLATALVSGRSEVRANVAEALGYVRGTVAEDLLTRALDDETPAVRGAAARSLAQAGAPRAAEALEAAAAFEVDPGAADAIAVALDRIPAKPPAATAAAAIDRMAAIPAGRWVLFSLALIAAGAVLFSRPRTLAVSPG